MNKYCKPFLLMVIILSVIVAGCSNSTEQKSSDSKGKATKKQALQISAAASLTDVTKDLEEAFEKQHKNVNVSFNYGGSGALRQQIEKGAPADVLMSANTKDVDALTEKNKAHHTYNYAKNKLILIGDDKQQYQQVSDLKQDDKLALGEVKSVPAGKYAEQYLKDQGLYKKIQDHIVYAKDVRQVLNYVDKGNAQLGYVYKTDLYQNQKNGNDKVKEIEDAPLKNPIIYKAATTSNNKMAKEWVDFLKTEKAKSILKKYKFEV
ncbi:molybdate ABC transporter substrate-binding protein [Staphylococcus sp. ACRSN]|uniref:molybdate ABC transporter substrate-binding protein n=1 Tax=Staphylococcus sp. ACRSN TaxID=2918214 RepID=UPI001EF179E5|nr:molybdate ABC transporter substrate-binding protein [Staphylococcus sp. ACRSN]MCG7338260.1 molybdate ABC transporter substrate-binding protein [Staphylococcus sp. ACRSN]